jgi:hypothetical protein
MNDIWKKILKPSGRDITMTAVKQFEDELGASMPNDYRDFILELNGGRVIDHSISLPGTDFDTFVSYLLPLTAPLPFTGLVESRKHQICDKCGLKHAIKIGNDAGTGFFIMPFLGPHKGKIFFAWKEDYWDQSWFEKERIDELPETYTPISENFTELAQLIYKNRTE